MRIGSMISYKEDEPNYTLYYALTIVVGLMVAYFLIIGGRLLRALFILAFEWWWAILIFIAAIILFRKWSRRKRL